MFSEPRYHLLSEACGKDHINVFFAGAGFSYDLAYDVGVRKRLLSWHANSDDDIDQYIKAQNDGKESFGIVDSGAFTVWNKGGSIDIDEYIDKLVTLAPYFDVAANLDIIPGKQGMAASDITPQMTHDAAKGGWDNYIAIEKGLLDKGGFDAKKCIMPIYHQGEHIDWLKTMVDYGCDYIGISPSNDYATTQRQHWLDDVYDYLSSLSKLPKTHGYAVTSPRLMKQYPWFSVDSASWVQQGGYGTVNTPYGVVTMTDRPDIMGRADALDGSKWSPEMRKKLIDYFISIGLDAEKVRSSHHERWKANAIYMLGIEKEMIYQKRPKPVDLFSIDEQPVSKQSEVAKAIPQVKQDCFGVSLTPRRMKGDIPMVLHDATKP